MARPRTPSNVLELRGAFDRHPERQRKDARGAGPFQSEPPEHLPQTALRAWRWIVDRLPAVAVYSTDEIAVEIAARLLAGWWETGDLATLRELRPWLGKLGFTPQDRANLPSAGPTIRENPFSRNGRRA